MGQGGGIPKGDIPIASRSGRTRDGNPLALSLRPRADLRPWFAWFNATDAGLPDGGIVECAMLNDLPCLRLMMGGRVKLHTRDGILQYDAREQGVALYFGPHSQHMKVELEGEFVVLSMQIAAGAAARMGGPPMPGMVDRVIDYDEWVGHGRLADYFKVGEAPSKWLRTFEGGLVELLEKAGTKPPNALAQAFDRQCLADPTFAIRDFADEHEVSPRTLERTIKRLFGLTPKQVARRARALDIASAYLGIAMEDEEAEARLRFFDQSHLIREMRFFFDQTPSQLRKQPHPMLCLNLETRQARKAAALHDIDPVNLPWRDPDAEPEVLETGEM